MSGEDRVFSALRGPFAGTEHHLDAPYWRTPQPVVERMLDLAGVGPGDTLIDLGSGDGRIVIAAALRGARAIGVDIDGERIAEAEAAAQAAGVAARVAFRREDLFATRLDEASVISLYLLGHVNLWLAPRLRTEPPPGARIVSYSFPMDGWAPDRVETIDFVTLGLWTVPDRG